MLISDIKLNNEYGDGSMIFRHVFAAATCRNDNSPVYGKRDGTGVSVSVGVMVGVIVGVGVAINSPQR